MMQALWLLSGLVLLAAVVLVIVWFVSGKRKLPSGAAARLMKQWKQATGNGDAHRRVLDGEKVLDSALSQLGYRGTFAEKLQTAGPRFSQLDQLWDAHRLRNRVAHEINVRVSDAEASRALQSFERALKELS